MINNFFLVWCKKVMTFGRFLIDGSMFYPLLSIKNTFHYLFKVVERETFLGIFLFLLDIAVQDKSLESKSVPESVEESTISDTLDGLEISSDADVVGIIKEVETLDWMEMVEERSVLDRTPSPYPFRDWEIVDVLEVEAID
jgi:hypothetical protein